jgi:hypothetical protein
MQKAMASAEDWPDLPLAAWRDRMAATPDALLLDFLRSTCEAAADRANWDRVLLGLSAAAGA